MSSLSKLCGAYAPVINKLKAEARQEPTDEQKQKLIESAEKVKTVIRDAIAFNRSSSESLQGNIDTLNDIPTRFGSQKLQTALKNEKTLNERKIKVLTKDETDANKMITDLDTLISSLGGGTPTTTTSSFRCDLSKVINQYRVGAAVSLLTFAVFKMYR
jgi:hypothetical protein